MTTITMLRARLSQLGSDTKRILLATVAMTLALIVSVFTAGPAAVSQNTSPSALTFPDRPAATNTASDDTGTQARHGADKPRVNTAPKQTICAATDEAAEAVGLTQEQASNAATITAVARERGLPERAVVVGLATAMQESHLDNLDYGDRDSLGLFQQRPSQGWGTPEQVTDPRYAAGQFYDRLAQVPGWHDQPVTVAAQTVQQSGFPDAYAQWEDEATTLAHTLDGATPRGTACH